MANDLSALGDLVIPVGGDISPFENALAAMPEAAADAAAKVNAAFENTSGPDQLSQELEALSSRLTQTAAGFEEVKEPATAAADAVYYASQSSEELAAATPAASEGLKQVSESAHAAGEGAKHAHDELGEMVEKIMELGGIALTLEALKEFTAESLGAYAAEEKVAKSLEIMTGSAKEAAEEIEVLKEKGAEFAVVPEQMFAAAQKMAAEQKYSLEQINAALESAANASAATGRSFDATAAAIDRIALSGSASAKVLAGLGITVDDLAEALGVSAKEAKDAFKELDPSERLEAIQTALEKYEGAAEKVASGVAGQWTRLKIQFEEQMVGIGEAVTPAAQTLMEFGSSMVTTAGEATKAVGDLAKEVRAGIGDVVEQFQAGILTEKEYGDAAAQAATGNKVFLESVVAIINPTIGATIAVGDLISAMLKLANAQDGLKAATALDEEQLKKMQITLNQQGIDIGDLARQYRTGEISVEEFKQKVAALVVAFRELHPVQQEAADSEEKLSAAAQASVDKAEKLTAAATQSKEAYRELKEQFDQGKVSALAVAVAYEAMTKAQEALNVGADDTIKSFAQINAAAGKAAAELDQAKSVFLAVQAEFISGQSSLAAYSAAWDQYANAAKAAGTVAVDTWHAITEATKKADDQITGLKNLVDTYIALYNIDNQTIPQQLATADAFKAVEAAASRLGLSVKDLGDHLEFGVNDKATKTQTAVKGLSDELNGLYGQTDRASVLINGKLVPVLGDLQTASDSTGVALGGITSTLRDVTDDAGNAAGQIQVLTGSTEDYNRAAFDLSTTQIMLDHTLESATDVIKRIAEEWYTAAQAATGYSQAAAAAGSATAAASSGGWGGGGGGGSRGGGGYGGHGQTYGAGAMLGDYAAAGASGGVLDAIAAAFGLVKLGNNQYASRDYLQSTGVTWTIGGGTSDQAVAVQDLTAATANAATSLDSFAYEESKAAQSTKTTTGALDTLASSSSGAAAVIQQAGISTGQALTGTLAPAIQTAAVAIVQTAAAYTHEAMTLLTGAGAGSTTQSTASIATQVNQAVAGVMRSAPTYYGPSLTGANGLVTPANQVHLTVSVQAGNVVGQNGMAQLADLAANEVVTRLRQITGLKLT